MNLGTFELSLTVKDLRASMEFYAKLGYSQIDGNIEENWAIMQLNESCIGLYQGHIKSNLLTFHGNEVFVAEKELMAKGLKMKTRAVREPDGSVGATLEDPDGNLVYLN